MKAVKAVDGRTVFIVQKVISKDHIKPRNGYRTGRIGIYAKATDLKIIFIRIVKWPLCFTVDIHLDTGIFYAYKSKV